MSERTFDRAELERLIAKRDNNNFLWEYEKELRDLAAFAKSLAEENEKQRFLMQNSAPFETSATKKERARAEAAESSLAALKAKLAEIKEQITECIDTHPDTADPVAHCRLLVHYMQKIETIATDGGSHG